MIEPDFKTVFQELHGETASARVTGLSPSGQAFLISEAARHRKKPVLVVVPTQKEAETLYRDLRFFLDPPENRGPERRRVFLFPAYELLPFQEVSPPVEVAARRVEALYALLSGESPVVVVTTSPAALQFVLPRRELNRYVEYVEAGEEIDREGLIERLVEGGYSRVPFVEERGDFAVRGGIVDLYTPLIDTPIRLELFGDFVESIRLFNVLSQRSFDRLQEWVVIPVSEILRRKSNLERAARRIAEQFPDPPAHRYADRLASETLFPGAEAFLPLFYSESETVGDYLPEESLVCYVDGGRLRSEAEDTLRRIGEHVGERGTPLSCRSWEETQSRFDTFPTLHLDSVPFESPRDTSRRYRFRSEDNLDIKSLATSGKKQWEQKRLLLERVEEWLQMGVEVVWVCASKRRATQLYEFFSQSDIPVRRDPLPFRRTSYTGIRIYEGTLSQGFKLWSEHLVLITDEEFLGTRHTVKRKSKTDVEAFVSSFEDLNPGDLVVHADHGIGRYRGLVQMAVDGTTGEFLLIEYEGGDRLYLPIYRLKAIQKYVGLDGHTPRLDRMGGRHWATMKRRVKASVERIAKELLSIYAARSCREGYAFSPGNGDMAEFAERFEYEETPDQSRAINEVMADMESPRPMDRLVCGDVGYGKTEVALRAAFKAVLDGKQVCFLVPTTVLAEQHLNTFRRRFHGYPVAIASLSRFKKPKEQREILEGLATGRIDIVIGTHRLLQKDVLFKNLGLLIIDEEQRFGVTHKEAIKKLKKLVDVLTLTATPIPRTLHMALMGIRDLSTIETPPQDRLSIKTYLGEFDDAIIRDAITRELNRRGQVFFVHNEVHTIENMAAYLSRLVPRARIGIAHGQLKEAQLERVMMAYLRKELDVLVCSTIIESGLDIPSANTIIINRADRLGLSQIYQLRGRVGRSTDRAYAYLLVPSESALTPEARKRLKVLMDFTELGAGFKIAFHDLQIRGGGEILGASQSGHIAAVGYEMYLELLAKSINELKGTVEEVPPEPEIHLPVAAFLPNDYIQSSHERLSLYKRISSLGPEEEIEEMRAELRDRFGPLPLEAENLLALVELRNAMKNARMLRLDWKNGELIYTFDPEGGVRVDALVDFVKKHAKRTRLLPEGRLFIKILRAEPNVLYEAKKALQELG